MIKNNLACLYQVQARYKKAERLFRDALQVCEELVGLEHPETVQILHNLIYFYGFQKRYEEGEHLWIRALCLEKILLRQKYPLAQMLQKQNALLVDALEYYATFPFSESEPLDEYDW